MCVQQIPVGETSPDFNHCTAAAAAAALAAAIAAAVAAIAAAVAAAVAAIAAAVAAIAAAAVFLVPTSSAHLPIAIYLPPVNI